MNKYIIPANSKKSQLILGFFTLVDLILFGSGATTTMILLLLVKDPSLVGLIIMLLPLLITGFLVMPVMYYHNVLQFLTNVFTYYLGRRRYYWKGWCIHSESNIK